MQQYNIFNKKTALLIATLFYLLLNSYGQTDSTSKDVKSTDFKTYQNEKIYQLFTTTRNKDIKQLWKTNLLDLNLILPSLSYERRIGKNFSSDTYLKLGLTNSMTSKLKNDAFHFLFEENIKFYYNLKKRELKGKKTSGFSGNYVALYGFYEYRKTSFPLYNASGYIERNTIGLGLKYGLQRRIGNIGYIEPCVGVYAYTPGIEIITPDDSGNIFTNGSIEYNLVFSLRAGFSIESFKNLKRFLH